MSPEYDPLASGWSGLQTPVGSRRSFFRRVTAGLAGLISVALAIPLLGYVISPALKRRVRPWVDIGSVDDVPLGNPNNLTMSRRFRTDT